MDTHTTAPQPPAAAGAADKAKSYKGAEIIVEYLIKYREWRGRPFATWAANEKTAYEEALGVSLAGRRSLVAMKHVGLNVAADPFMNSAIVSVRGGLVVIVADDPIWNHQTMRLSIDPWSK